MGRRRLGAPAWQMRRKPQSDDSTYALRQQPQSSLDDIRSIGQWVVGTGVVKQCVVSPPQSRLSHS